MIKYNIINDRIVNEILKGKDKINLDKEIIKEEDEEPGSFNKLVGNLTAMTLRKYIINIINYYGLNLKVSSSNAFISGCPIEWDLIILKNDAEDINNTNVFNFKDIVAVLEFKTSGLRRKQLENIDNTFFQHFKYLERLNKKHNKHVLFGYITFTEAPDFFEKTKEFFDKKNNVSKIPTAFAFLDYDSYQKYDKKKYIDECNDFEEFLYGILKGENY